MSDVQSGSTLASSETRGDGASSRHRSLTTREAAAALLGTGLAHRERLGAHLRPHVQAGINEPIAAVLDAILRERPDPYGLTRRERDVPRRLAAGLADKEIAATLFVARATASTHVAAILEKFGVDSRTAAVAVALGHNLV